MQRSQMQIPLRLAMMHITLSLVMPQKLHWTRWIRWYRKFYLRNSEAPSLFGVRPHPETDPKE